jgi:hypothetical protein
MPPKESKTIKPRTSKKKGGEEPEPYIPPVSDELKKFFEEHNIESTIVGGKCDLKKKPRTSKKKGGDIAPIYNPQFVPLKLSKETKEYLESYDIPIPMTLSSSSVGGKRTSKKK